MKFEKLNEYSLLCAPFRNFYKRLCNDDQITACINHPAVEGKKMYLLFDSTHNIKNAFNNWNRKHEFHYPLDFEDLLDPNGVASFRHIFQLTQREETMALKVARKLTKPSLYPTSIEKTSPKHALGKFISNSNNISFSCICFCFFHLAVFDESTVRALMFYDAPGWKMTSQFVSLFTNVWKILNVKSPLKGKQKILREYNICFFLHFHSPHLQR